jgi:hypothetical protein
MARPIFDQRQDQHLRTTAFHFPVQHRWRSHML